MPLSDPPCRRTLLILGLIGSEPRAVWGQRPGGEVRKRRDDKGLAYFEVFADHLAGNHGEPAPMRIDRETPHWPKRIAIRAESFWMIARAESGKVDADGVRANAQRLVASGLPKGALIARWTTLDITQRPAFPVELPTTPVSDWFLVGRSSEVEVPIPGKVQPRRYSPGLFASLAGLDPQPEFQYTPLVGLQYQCNDGIGEFGDNDGWLHVYQTWIW